MRNGKHGPEPKAPYLSENTMFSPNPSAPFPNQLETAKLSPTVGAGDSASPCKLNKGLRDMRLTQKSVEGLTSDGRRRDVTVSGMPGLIVRVARAHGRDVRTWRYRYFRDGRAQIATLGDFPAVSVSAARVLHAELIEIARNGGDPRAHVEARALSRLPASARLASTGPTVRDVVDDFLRTTDRKRPEQVRALLEANVLPEIGDLAAADVRKRDFLRIYDVILARDSKTVANRVHALLKQVFAVALDHDLIDVMPGFPRDKPGGPEHPRERVLADDEIATLWRTLDALTPSGKRGKGITRPLALALKIALVTAQRRGEIATAKWADIVEIDTVDATGKRGRRKAWHIPETKTDAAHTVPLSPLALRLLDELREHAGTSPYWLPNALNPAASADDRARTITAAAKRIRADVGIDEWTPHDLRRTARTGMAALGVPDAVAKRCLNHADGDRMARIYNRHSYAAEMGDALDRWAAHVEKITV
jgi:integrase